VLVLQGDTEGSFVLVVEGWMLHRVDQAVHSQVAVVDIHVLVEQVVGSTGLMEAAGHAKVVVEVARTAARRDVVVLVVVLVAVLVAEDNPQVAVLTQDSHTLEAPTEHLEEHWSQQKTGGSPRENHNVQ
jgi:hypothetical protein